MKTVTLDVQPLAGSLTDFARAWKTGKRDAAARISFATPDLLWNVLTTKRWDLLKAMAGQGSHEPAAKRRHRRVHRDVKGAPWRRARVARRRRCCAEPTTRKIEFPYDAVHVEFTLRAA